MNISQLPVGTIVHAALGRMVLVVICRRVDGWRAYIGAVPGKNHDTEWQAVAAKGDKLPEPVARAIAGSFFGLELDLKYVQ